MDVKDIKIEDFNYHLPDTQIAYYPLPNRASSKLAICKNGEFSQNIFENIVDFLDKNSLLLFNETKVVHARIVFFTENGHRIEIFCLEPENPKEVVENFSQRKSVVWKCFIGNNKKWKNGLISCKSENCAVNISRLDAIDNAWFLKFDWDNGESFSEILDKIGKMPLPPYIKREVEESDEDRYQTIFARNEGSVAAPTASLHFTDEVLRKIEEKGIKTAKLTLHIGAGTFKPVDTELIGKHKMHAERVVVAKNTLQTIVDALNEGRKIIPVGTTAMRSLESLYWLTGNYVEQFAPYLSNQNTINPKIKLEEIISKTKDDLQFSTELMIAPSYKFRFADGLITNFHQPKSTLLLLVAALLQEKQQANWKNLYDYALENNFRFLSYGDSCLL